MTTDALVSLFNAPLAPPSQDMRFRQGVVESWNPLTAENTVQVGGTVLTDLPVLNTSEALTLRPGDVVAVAVIGDTGARTYAIMGRLTIPNTPSAASALNAFSSRVQTNTVTASESTTSVVYTDLTTPGPTVTDVPVTTGRAIVFCAADMQPTASENAYMNVAVSGATSIAPNSAQLDPQAYIVGWGAADQVPVSASRPILVTGLNVGYHTFQAKYRTGTGNLVTIRNRSLIVFAL